MCLHMGCPFLCRYLASANIEKIRSIFEMRLCVVTWESVWREASANIEKIRSVFEMRLCVVTWESVWREASANIEKIRSIFEMWLCVVTWRIACGERRAPKKSGAFLRCGSALNQGAGGDASGNGKSSRKGLLLLKGGYVTRFYKKIWSYRFSLLFP